MLVTIKALTKVCGSNKGLCALFFGWCFIGGIGHLGCFAKYFKNISHFIW